MQVCATLAAILLDEAVDAPARLQPMARELVEHLGWGVRLARRKVGGEGGHEQRVQQQITRHLDSARGSRHRSGGARGRVALGRGCGSRGGREREPGRGERQVELDALLPDALDEFTAQSLELGEPLIARVLRVRVLRRLRRPFVRQSTLPGLKQSECGERFGAAGGGEVREARLEEGDVFTRRLGFLFVCGEIGGAYAARARCRLIALGVALGGGIALGERLQEWVGQRQ